MMKTRSVPSNQLIGTLGVFDWLIIVCQLIGPNRGAERKLKPNKLTGIAEYRDVLLVWQSTEAKLSMPMKLMVPTWSSISIIYFFNCLDVITCGIKEAVKQPHFMLLSLFFESIHFSMRWSIPNKPYNLSLLLLSRRKIQFTRAWDMVH
jgi:hypothetical protein